MPPSFSTRLVNDVFDDPGLYVDINWTNRALLFDLGENRALGSTRLLRAQHLFISHTHMDHFIGFDHWLRVHLGRGKTVHLYGPPGLSDNVAGKLRGYTWNLVDGSPLTLTVHEFGPHGCRHSTFAASEAFARRDGLVEPDRHATWDRPFPVLEEEAWTVRAVPLNHRIPSFAYAVEERFHINVLKERLREAGLPVGSWLKDLKQHLWEGKPDEFQFAATLFFEHRRETREFTLGDLRQFVRVTRGHKLAYVVDARYDPDNEAKIVALAEGADILYCEAAYLDRDADKAADRYHLTARQAGHMARLAGVKKLVVFHFSPRYTGMGDQLDHEAQQAFTGTGAQAEGGAGHE